MTILEAQATSRVPQLVPIRYGRMLKSPFAFYRGAAAIMAYDLMSTPGLVIDEKLVSSGRIPTQAEIRQWTAA